jgi:hypothetical protein
MSWAGLANNQTVSFANLKDAVDTGVFISKTTQSTSNEEITKQDAIDKAWVNTLYSQLSSKSSNQLVVKSNLIRQCWCWNVTNDDSVSRTVTFTPCGNAAGDTVNVTINCCGDLIRFCSNTIPTINTFFATVDICGSGGTATNCYTESDCTGCSDCGSPCGGQPF